MLHPGQATLFDRGRLHLGILIHEMTQALVDGYNGIQTVTTRYLHHAATGSATPAEVYTAHPSPRDKF